MLAIDLIDGSDGEEEIGGLRIVTRRTTKNMQIETGVMILIISSPRVSIMLLGFGIWAIWVVELRVRMGVMRV